MELGIDVKGNEYGETSPVLNVSMGAQINHYIFVGGGFGGRYYTDSKVWAVPIYANLRADVINSRINPFVDVKIGYTPIDLKGFFASAGIGCRFRCGDRFALGLSAGYEIQNAEYYHGYSSYSRENLGDVFVRLGFEW